MDEPGESEKLQSLGDPGQQRRVFISYSSHDAPVAQNVCSALEAAGFSCWIAPRNVLPGTMYADGIVHAIDESSILVLILSAQAVASAHVGREIERAVAKRHPVVALRIDNAPLTAAFEYFLNQSQWIEGRGSDAAIAQLVAAVGQHLAPGRSTSTTNANQTSAVHRSGTKPRRIWVFAAVALAVLLAGGYLLDKVWRSKQATTASTAVISDKSIAVLPFVDMSEKKDQEYFSDGLSEELINMLTKVPELRVPARTSSFYFKGKQATIAEIAEALGVTNVLEGSVRKSGNKLRITAQLIRADNGYHLWSETYDRNLDDIFKVQDEIAAAVVSALKLSLLSRTLRKATGTTNSDAYTLYLQAGGLIGRGTVADLEKASDYVRQALQLDPSFAAGWARLTQTITTQYEAGAVPRSEAAEAARRAAERAIALDPDLGTAHLAMARVHVFFDWDWAAADAEIRRARQLDPNDVDALRWAGALALTLGHFGESVTLLDQAVGRDPLMAANYVQLGLARRAVGDMAAAETACRKAMDLAPPNGLGARQMLADLLLFTGHAGEYLVNCPNRSPDERAICDAIGKFASGQKAEADAALATLQTSYAAGNEMTIADIYALRGDSDKTFTWLDRAYDARDPDLLEILGDPYLQNLRSDPRYKAFLKKMKLPDE